MDKMSSEVEKPDELDIPLGLDYKKWQFLVKGLLKTDADKKPVTANQLSEFTNIPMSKVISNIKFLKLLGIITPESKSSGISLTEDGTRYAQSLFLPDPRLEKELLAKFSGTGLQNLVGFCNLHSSNNDLTFDKLFNQIKLLSRTNDMQGAIRNTHTDYRVGIYTIIELLVTSGTLPESFLPSNNEVKTEQVDSTSEGSTAGRSKTTFEIPVNMQRDWMIKLFTAISRMNQSTKIDKNFITANVDKNRHEGTILSFAQFLDITDSNGGHGKNYDKLRLYGTSEFANNLAEVVKEKYSKILSTANLEIAQRDGLEALIMKQFGMNKPQAERAVNTLIRLCELANIPLSENLVRRQVSTETKKPIATSATKKTPTPATPSVTPKQPTMMDHSGEASGNLAIKIEIHIDSKDETAFANTLKFIKELRMIDDIQTAEVSISGESAN